MVGDGLRLAVILCMGRSGSTLLRNELCKPEEVSALSSNGGYEWFDAYRTLLLDDPDALARPEVAARLRAEWHTRGFVHADLKQSFALAPPAPGLGRVLLCKFALFGFGARSRGLFRAADVIHLVRDPAAIHASLCRPLGWNGGQPFYAGARAPLLPARTADLAAFAACETPEVATSAPEQLTALPYPLACARLLADYVRVHAAVLRRPDFARNATTLRFEDLLADRAGELARLARFLELRDARFPPNDQFFRPVDSEGGIRMAEPLGARERDQPADPGPLASEVAEVIAPARTALGYH